MAAGSGGLPAACMHGLFSCCSEGGTEQVTNDTNAIKTAVQHHASSSWASSASAATTAVAAALLVAADVGMPSGAVGEE